MNFHINMSTRVKRVDLLKTLKENLERHSEIVKEAREGYMKKAEEALKKRLRQLKEGLLVSLSFRLTPPADYSEVYKTAIQMLEWNQEEYLNLGAQEFRQFVQDKWDWQQSFLTSNIGYSKKAMDWMQEQTGGALVQPPEE